MAKICAAQQTAIEKTGSALPSDIHSTASWETFSSALARELDSGCAGLPVLDIDLNVSRKLFEQHIRTLPDEAAMDILGKYSIRVPLTLSRRLRLWMLPDGSGFFCGQSRNWHTISEVLVRAQLHILNAIGGERTLGDRHRMLADEHKLQAAKAPAKELAIPMPSPTPLHILMTEFLNASWTGEPTASGKPGLLWKDGAEAKLHHGGACVTPKWIYDKFMASAPDKAEEQLMELLRLRFGDPLV